MMRKRADSNGLSVLLYTLSIDRIINKSAQNQYILLVLPVNSGAARHMSGALKG